MRRRARHWRPRWRSHQRSMRGLARAPVARLAVRQREKPRDRAVATSREKWRRMLSRPPAASCSHSASSRYARTIASANALRIVADQHVLARRQVHALDRRRRRHDRQAVAHRQVDLALDAGAVAQRRDRDAAAAEIRRHVGNVAGDDEVVGGQRRDRRRRIGCRRCSVFTPGSLLRTCGRISRAYQSTASVLGGCWKPPMNTQALALGERLAVRHGSWMFDSTITRASGASSRQQSLLDGATTSVTSALRISASSSSRLRARRLRASPGCPRAPPAAPRAGSAGRRCRTRSARRGANARTVVDVLDARCSGATARRCRTRRRARRAASAIELAYGWNSTSMPRCCSACDIGLAVFEIVGDERHLAAAAPVRISSIACMRSEPESWSGVSMHASITSDARLRPAVALELGCDAVRRGGGRAPPPTSRRTCRD